MQRRRAWLSGLAFVCALCVAACGGSSPQRARLPASIVVGYSYSGSGGANGCRAVRDGYQLWADAVNRAGGIAVGSQHVAIALLGYDDGGNAAQAARNAERLLLQDGAVALLGPCDEAASEAMATVAEHYARLLVVTTPYADSLLARRYRYVLDVAPTAANAGKLAAGDLAHQSPRPRVGVLWADDQPARALGAAALAALSAQGLAVDALGAYPAGTTDFRAQLARARASADTTLLLAGHGSEARALSAALRPPATGLPFMFLPSDGDVSDPESSALLTPWAAQGSNASDSLFGSVSGFSQAFAAATGGRADARAALATAGGELIGAALHGAASLDSSALRAWLLRGGTLTSVAGTLTRGVEAGSAAVLPLAVSAGTPLPAVLSPAPVGTPNGRPASRGTPKP